MSLAWKIHYREEDEKALGSDAWAYGVEKNHAALDKLLSYAYDMGVSKRKMTAEELFDPNDLTII